MSHIKPEHQEFYDQNPPARAVLEAFHAIRERHGGKIQFWDVIDLTIDDEANPDITIDVTDVVRDPDLDDEQALKLEAQSQTALAEIIQRRYDEAEPQTVSLDRLDDIEDVDEYMHVIDSGEENIVPITFVGQAEQLRDPHSRTTLFKHAGTTALVQTLRIEQTDDVCQRVELHTLGDN